jgi:hypothetical protein
MGWPPPQRMMLVVSMVPSCRAMSAMKGFHVEPGGCMDCVARLYMGLTLLSVR